MNCHSVVRRKLRSELPPVVVTQHLSPDGSADALLTDPLATSICICRPVELWQWALPVQHGHLTQKACTGLTSSPSGQRWIGGTVAVRPPFRPRGWTLPRVQVGPCQSRCFSLHSRSTPAPIAGGTPTSRTTRCCCRLTKTSGEPPQEGLPWVLLPSVSGPFPAQVHKVTTCRPGVGCALSS